MALVFFDLDRTLIAHNSAARWVGRELNLGNLTKLQALTASWWFLKYHLGGARLEHAIAEAIGTLQGSSAEEMRIRAFDFYQSEVRPHYRPGALRAVARHRRQGDHLVLLTSSTEYVAEPVMKDLGLDGILCNRLQVDEKGRHTGKTEGPICFGKGKLSWAEQYATKQGMRLDEGVFYTDAYADLPVLQVVRRPVAVNADPRLRKLARRNGWLRVDWGLPVVPPRT